jgi:plastocyanin
VVGANSPTNYAGQSGSVDAGGPLFGDADGDGDVDLVDYEGFAECLLGPDVPVVSMPQTHNVSVGPGSVFTPEDIDITEGDTVHWVWDGGNHNVWSGVGSFDGNFRSGAATSVVGTTYDVLFDTAFVAAHPMPGGVYPYYCTVHFDAGMVGSVTVAGAIDCSAFDSDEDDDVDFEDFLAFQQSFTGD